MQRLRTLGALPATPSSGEQRRHQTTHQDMAATSIGGNGVSLPGGSSDDPSSYSGCQPGTTQRINSSRGGGAREKEETEEDEMDIFAAIEDLVSHSAGFRPDLSSSRDRGGGAGRKAGRKTVLASEITKRYTSAVRKPGDETTNTQPLTLNPKP